MPVETQLLPPRYHSPRRIGHGAMGDIYLATDETLGREVAVKLLSDRYAADVGIRERFKREALAAARLSGEPGAITIFDVGEWEDRPFIVMEYLGGGSLEDRLRRDGAQPPARALAWLEQAAAALDAAHRHGIVHRDVKPANLLLNERGELRVADFGIASAAGMDSMTLTGTVLGTAGYLSPEQAQGERATPASDLYALAVVAYELLSGRAAVRERLADRRGGRARERARAVDRGALREPAARGRPRLPARAGQGPAAALRLGARARRRAARARSPAPRARRRLSPRPARAVARPA